MTRLMAEQKERLVIVGVGGVIADEVLSPVLMDELALLQKAINGLRVPGGREPYTMPEIFLLCAGVGMNILVGDYAKKQAEHGRRVVISEFETT